MKQSTRQVFLSFDSGSSQLMSVFHASKPVCHVPPGPLASVVRGFLKARRPTLVLGSGGREHALAWKLSKSPEAGRAEIWVEINPAGGPQV